MAAGVESYITIVNKAYKGQLKLPAFQRAWKWKPSQVMLLLDSLRRGFPIGSFLFLQANPTVDLKPREFRGAAADANKGLIEDLVLDGQQRITAGLELFHDRGSNQYFIDIKKITRIAEQRGVDLDDDKSIRSFLENLDSEDGYCTRRKAAADPKSRLIESHLLWTGLLLDDNELERAVSDYAKAYPDQEKVIRYLIGRNFRPSQDANIPITTISGATPIEAISRIFSTLNSTGKMLTPFELVVSVLFPDISLNDEVVEYRELAPTYAKIDATGDILLQTIALFDGKDTKKASLPKLINDDSYSKFAAECVQHLEDSGRFISDQVGVGLDALNELLVYPVIFTPLAYVWSESQENEP